MVRRNESLDRFAEAPTGRKAAKIPFDFVLEALAPLSPTTRLMFGCTAVYVGERIVFALRKKQGDAHDSGVWVATTEAHHASLREALPSLRSISVFGVGVTGWQNLPETADDFEESALRACALVRAGDPRIGKVPAKKRVAAKKATEKKATEKKKPAKKG